MKHLLSLERLDVGRTLALTVGSPSAHRRGTTLKHLAFLLLFLFSFGVGNAWGTEAAYKTAKFGSAATSGSSNNYSSTWTSTYNGFSVSVTNGNTNNTSWNNVRFGSKSGASTGTIVTGAIDKKVTSVSIVLDGVNTSYTTSIKLYISNNGSSWAEKGSFTKSTGTKTVTIPTADQATNLHYKVEIVCTKSNSTTGNGFVKISQVDYNVETFTVSYNANGGSGSMSDASSPYFNGASVTTKTNTFTAPSGKTFDHWDTKSDDSGTDYAEGAKFNIAANTTLYAQWAGGSSNPTLSAEPSPANSGTIAIMHGETPFESGSEFEALETYTLTATPETGYKFVYWSLSDGTDAELVDDDEVANNEDEKNPVGILMAEETTTVTAHFAQPATVGDATNVSCTGASFAVSNSSGRNNYIVYTTSSTATAATAESWTSAKNGNGTITISSGLSKNTKYYYWCASEVASGHYVYTDKKNFTTANNFDLDLTLEDGKGNTASAPSYTCIASGTSVTLTASPASGYVVSGWTVLDGSSNEITPTATTATTFTFNMPTSNVTAEAIFQQQVVAPTFSPAAGTYESTQSVAISTTTPSATIYYTIGTNPADPTTGSTPYTSAISVSSNQTIKAIAVKDGMANSAVSTAAYEIKCAAPTFVTAGGTYTGAQSVAINVPTGTTVYYTTDGSTPDNTKTEYTGAINVAAGMTIKAIAVKDGMANSDVASATYTIQYTVTWKVNGVALSGVALGDATVLVTAGGTVSKLPTEPDPADYCGQRFMGWTNSDMGSTMGQSAPGVLFKTAASAPAVNGTTVYHAVFADYKE